MGWFPTIDLLFSIYRVGSTGIQFYFNKKEGCQKLTSATASKSGWHDRWPRYKGCELSRIGPWKPLCPARVRSLNWLGSGTSEELRAFHGSSSRYRVDDFIDERF